MKIRNFILNKNPNKMMMIFENNGQMQRGGENMGEPPEKPQGEFKGNMQNSNI